jgi:Sortase domain
VLTAGNRHWAARYRGRLRAVWASLAGTLALLVTGLLSQQHDPAPPRDPARFRPPGLRLRPPRHPDSRDRRRRGVAISAVRGSFGLRPPPVDSDQGPGAFFRLGALRPGDRIYVTRADGTLAIFRVEAVDEYSKDSFPTEQVYGPVSYAGLRVITCGGSFDFQTHHYLPTSSSTPRSPAPGQERRRGLATAVRDHQGAHDLREQAGAGPG